MRLNPCPLIALVAFFAFSVPVLAQGKPDPFRVYLQNGAFTPEPGISDVSLSALSKSALRTSGRAMALMQFEQMPGKAERLLLQQNGITLLDYIPQFSFIISYTGELKRSLLQQLHVRAVTSLAPQQKMDPQLAAGHIPSRAISIAGTADVMISFPSVFSANEVEAELKARNFVILPSLYREYRMLSVRLSSARIAELASLPFVEYVQPAMGPDQLLNNKSTVNARSNVLRSLLPGGRGLDGSGVVVGIGDDSNPMNHIDFSERVINRNPITGGAHGLHVMGITGGAGIIEEKYTGFAPKTTIISQALSNILVYTPAYVTDHHMVISNNSYGNVTNDCLNFGYYQLASRVMDQQATTYPSLSIVFAAGNSGLVNCGVYPASYGTVLSDFQSAKNVIDVGAATENDSIAPSSSRGPVKDGRIKPELVAQGRRVVSAWSNNIYSFNSGTSMAAPAVSGGLALLYQRYRQLNAGADPKNALMKTLLLNGATDVGNPGPDYTYGFGWMNLLRSVQMLENGQWFTNTVAPAATNTHTITLPASPAGRQLKVMLYWNDSAASVLAAHALVNDLDLEVVDPSLNTVLPQVLDTIPANVRNNSVPGVDRINNIEQVVINNPVAGGTYTVKVKGTTIPSAVAQEYFVAWDLIPDSTTLTYPIGGERIKSGDSLYISWDAWGAPGNTFKLEYSLNNGGSWTVINNNIPDSVRQWNWFAPAGPTETARIRITNNNTGMVSTSAAFIIIGVPVISLSAVQCEGYASVDWTAVTGATDYEVMMDRGGEMVSVATTNALTYSISGLSKDSIYWISVRARLNGVPGPRAYATSRQPNSGTCAGSISDNDVKLDSLISPATGGRKFTSTAFGAAQPIKVRIRNLDDATTSGDLQARYFINGGTPVVETITAPNIAAGATFDYTFTTTADLSAIGTYQITASVTRTGDPVAANDTIRRTVKQLDNPAISLTSTFLDDLETATAQEWTYRVCGLDGLDRYDFVNSSSLGRIRSFINSGLAYSGSKALTLDASTYAPSGNTDSLTGTFNLNSYTAATDDIRLDFRYKNHAQNPNAANKVWIRGNDTQPWIQVYDLFANQNAADGSYKLSTSIELTDSLQAYGQDFSSSFQVRWGQWGKYLTADNDGGAGYSFDDIRLYKVTNDLQMMSIDTPVSNSCALSATTPVKVTLRNTANNAVTGAQIVLKVDGSVIATETLPLIPANTTGQYTFTATANLAATGAHTVQVYTLFASDTYAENDTAQTTLVNSPRVSVTASSEYLQNFESNNGGWYTSGGRNSTWQYGTPASTKINRAASGAKAWKTSSVGTYSDAEQSYLYSPCFDISTLSNPTLSLSIALDLEDCGSGLCDGAWVEYSADGITWNRLGAYNQAGSTNWYNKNYASNNLWSVQDYTRWHVATVKLPAGLSNLRLRFVMSSDISVDKEGIAIDDIHIYDNPYGIYTGPVNTGVINQASVSGSNWIDFIDPGTNKLVASVNPNGSNMGSTDVRAYFNTGAVRYNLNQYYHDRNITIIPTNLTLADSASVRFYFTDAETDTLINASSCAFCYKPASAYDLGVSKYSDPVKSIENGTIADNALGTWTFIKPDSAVKVPFDKGYYAEFKVNDFSEFWLNNGGLTRSRPLPVTLSDFSVTRQNADAVLVSWTIATEINVDHYEIKAANGTGSYQQNQFSRLGPVASFGNSTQPRRYTFTDAETGKSGVRYYRLRTVDRDGHSSYSAVRSLIFDKDISWQVYPNPSAGMFELLMQVPDRQSLSFRVLDATGKTVKSGLATGTGFGQKLTIDLTAARFAAGLYMLEVSAEGEKRYFKLIKH